MKLVILTLCLGTLALATYAAVTARAVSLRVKRGAVNASLVESDLAHVQRTQLQLNELVVADGRRINALDEAHEQLYSTYKASADEAMNRIEPLEADLERRRERTAPARAALAQQRAQGATA